MRPRTDPIARFLAKIDVTDDGCWIYTGGTNHQGYGKFWLDGKTVTSHRFAFTAFRGDVPDGLHLDHTCHNDAAAAGRCAGGPTCAHRRCSNPDHLRATHPSQNVTASPLTIAGINQRKTHCPSGHEYDHVNINGDRGCRTCQAAAWKRSWAKRKAAA